MIKNNKAYDILKFVALIALPGLNTFWVGFGELWDLNNVAQIAGTIALVDTLLGTLLGVSSIQYRKKPLDYDGKLGISGFDPDTGIPNLQLTVTKDPNEIAEKDHAILKIESPK